MLLGLGHEHTLVVLGVGSRGERGTVTADCS